MVSCLPGLLHFCVHQVRFVGTVLQHLMQEIRSFGLRYRDLRPHVQHGIDRGKKRFPAVSHAVSYDDAVGRIPVFDLVCSDEDRIQSQDPGNVLCLSAVPPRPIRDGPIRRGQPVSELWPAAYREAA